MGWFEAILAVSIIINIVLVYYSSIVARRLYLAATNLEALDNIISSFLDHVKTVHEMEMFYGDQTLQSLIDHSTLILEELDAYEDIMNVLVEEAEFPDEGEVVEEEKI